MNNISFSARLFIPKNNTFTNDAKREARIKNIFEQQTSNSPDEVLFIDDFQKGKFSIAIEGTKEQSQSFNFKNPEKMTDEQLSRKLVDIFDVLKLKAQQDISIRDLKASRKETYNSYQRKIKAQQSQGINIRSLKTLQEQTFMEDTRQIASLKRIFDAELDSLIISKNLSDKI